MWNQNKGPKELFIVLINYIYLKLIFFIKNDQSKNYEELYIDFTVREAPFCQFFRKMSFLVKFSEKKTKFY